MALYRQVYMKFWNDDSKVVDDFTPEDKYFFLYLMTNPHTTLTGCYEISFKVMARETGYNEETVKRLMDRMGRVHHVICYDQNTKEVLIVNWHKYNWTKSADLVKAVKSQAAYIKNEMFREYVIGLAEGETVPTPSHDGGGTSISVSVTDTDSISINKTKVKKEKHPSVEEVAEYCRERNNNVDPEEFVDYYSSQNWKKANGQPLTDWKAGVRTFEKKPYNRPKPKQEEKIDLSDYYKENGWID